MSFGLGGSSRLRDDMNVAIGDKATRITRLYRTEPERRVRRLRRQYVRDVGALNILVVQGGGIEHGVLARLVRTIDVHRQPRAIPHRDADIPLLDHLLLLRPALRRSPPRLTTADAVADGAVIRTFLGGLVPLYFTIVKYYMDARTAY